MRSPPALVLAPREDLSPSLQVWRRCNAAWNQFPSRSRIRSSISATGVGRHTGAGCISRRIRISPSRCCSVGRASLPAHPRDRHQPSGRARRPPHLLPSLCNNPDAAGVPARTCRPPKCPPPSVGWALSGYCPGPAVASLASGQIQTIVVVLAIAAGMMIYDLAPIVPRILRGVPD